MNTNAYFKNHILVALLIATIGLYSFTFFQAKPWNVPEAFAKKTNPVKSDGEFIQTGKKTSEQTLPVMPQNEGCR